jgi:hypothetical protein
MKAQEKKKLLKSLQRYISAAEKVAILLIGEESTHSAHQDTLYRVRQEMSSCLISLDYIKYN